MAMRRVLAIAVALSACGDNLGAPGPDGIFANPADVFLEIGETAELAAHYGGNFAPDDIVWTTSDPAIVQVAGSGEMATVTAVKAGSATVTASGRGLANTVNVTVAPAHLVRIAIMPVQPTLAAGTTTNVTVLGTFSDDTTADVTAMVTWTSDRPNIATVADGVITGLIVGEAEITATLDGLFSTTRVVVSAAKLLTIDVTPDATSVALGLVVQFTATGHFTDQATQDLTNQVTWASSMTNIVTISNTAPTKGKATSVATGTSTISATSGTIVGMTDLTVSAAQLVSIAISPQASSIARLVNQPFTATGTFTDATTSDVTAAVT